MSPIQVQVHALIVGAPVILVQVPHVNAAAIRHTILYRLAENRAER
jgi:hypothetical protein